MSHSIKNTFIVPVVNDYLVYSPMVGVSAFINRAGVIELQDQLQLVYENQGNPDTKLFELANDIVNRPILSPIKRTGDLSPEFLGIIPTRSCNGACNYCDFGADLASEEKMSYQTALKAVEWYIGLLKSQKRNYLDIHFFGGEPMMARDILEVVIHRARIITSKQKMIPLFEISTNGQYSSYDAHFLGQYFNKVVLSFDGFKEVQNKHRPLKGNRSSFENVLNTAKIISNSNAELCIRCCVSRENIKQMEEYTKWLCENFNLSAINFEVLTPSHLSVSVGLSPPDCFEFAIYFEKSRQLAKGYGIEVIYASDISKVPVVSSCPVGKDTAIISPDGRISNCYLQPEKWQKNGLDLDFGSVSSDKEIKIENNKIEAIRKMVEKKPRCTNCFCKWSCSGGCHVGITHPGSGNSYDDFCKQTRLISAFTLLSDLGLHKQLKNLSESPEALRLLASQETDSINDFIK